MSRIQAVLFDKDDWTLDGAKSWLQIHKLDYKSYRTTKKYYRFRIREPTEFDYFRLKKIGKGLILDIGFHYDLDDFY